MSGKEIFIVKADITNNNKSVGDDTKLIGIAECPLMCICRMAGLAAA